MAIGGRAGSSLGLTAAYGRRAAGEHTAGRSFAWHGVTRSMAASEKGYERVVLPSTLQAPQRAALRSLALAAGLRIEAIGPKSARRLEMSLPSPCACCPNALVLPGDVPLTTEQLRVALVDVFGVTPLTKEDIT